MKTLRLLPFVALFVACTPDHPSPEMSWAADVDPVEAEKVALIHGPGEGPGEFSSPNWLSVLEDEVSARDRRVTSTFRADGEWVERGPSGASIQRRTHRRPSPTLKSNTSAGLPLPSPGNHSTSLAI
jgi:hypothetical protein